MRQDIYIAITILKAIIIIVGMCFVMPNLIRGFRDNDRHKLKKAGFVFLGIFILIAILTAIEFAIALN